MRPLASVAAVLAAASVFALTARKAAVACEASHHLRYDEPVEVEGLLQSATGHHDVQGDFNYVYVRWISRCASMRPQTGVMRTSATPVRRTPSTISKSPAISLLKGSRSASG
jgi:hypothetical protein